MNKEVNWKKDNPKVHGRTIREQIEELVLESPHYKDARIMLNFMAGYYGTENAPVIDAGVFLYHFLQAVEDGVLEWEDRI